MSSLLICDSPAHTREGFENQSVLELLATLITALPRISDCFRRRGSSSGSRSVDFHQTTRRHHAAGPAREATKTGWRRASDGSEIKSASARYVRRGR
jgi:hypothetical protein